MNLYRPFIPTEAERMEEAEERAWEALREECAAEFEEWRAGDWRNREFADFSNWLVSKARWNGQNKYREALNWHERALVEMGGKVA